MDEQRDATVQASRDAGTHDLPLVFVHGSGDTARAWGAVVAALPGRACLALDLPGHGAERERPGPAEMSVADYAAWVRGELDRRGLGPICLIGHSLGSAIALRLAADAPERVRRIVLVGGGARLRVLPAMLEAAREQPEAAGAQLSALAFANSHSAERDAHQARPAELAPGMLYRDLAACDRFDMMGELAQIRQPALIVTGEQDQLTPPKYATYLRDHLPSATLVLVPGAGHYLPLEAPAALAAALTSWLQHGSEV
jgi:pimeloyl-ACP methyl ester carboxylesterase